MKKGRKPLNDKTPQWFKDWHARFFNPVDSRSKRNERLIYILLAVVLGINTFGNEYHAEIFNFLQKIPAFFQSLVGG